MKRTGYDDMVARFRESEARAEERRVAASKKGPLTGTQRALLEHLAAVAVRQKTEARINRKRFPGGWTYIRFGKQVKLNTIVRLLDLGYAAACCEGHYGNDSVRITKAGVIHLESLRGEEILA